MIADKVHEFARGASFEVIMSLPINVPDMYFHTWQPLSQIRQAGNLTKDGLIGELTFTWLEDGEGGRKFMLSSEETDRWPFGDAELDVLFSSPTGRRIRTKKLTVKIVPGITAD
jgi:hypothetical protein